MPTTNDATNDADDENDDGGDARRWWGKLVPVTEASKDAKHIDRASATRDAASGALRAVRTHEAVLRSDDVKLRLKSVVFGRLVMNKEGTARAKIQPADVALDVPSGA